MRHVVSSHFVFLISLVASAHAQVDFERQIAPIFARHCIRCHEPGTEKGDVSLATVESLGNNGYLEGDEPAETVLMELIAGVDGEPPAMPKDAEPLSSGDVALIQKWIAEGAHWPTDVVVRQATKADASWWSLQPIRREHGDATIDDFIRSTLRQEALEMNPPADRRTLIRRATYDLIGLPPTPEEIQAFLKDEAPDAYEQLIDRLLASPHYGERWGRHWLDVVRFGESIGYERNVIVNNIWPFRDYVIRSLNEDKPFDQFIREHLAGDVIGAGNPDMAVGSAFLVAGPYDDVGNQDAIQAAQIRANTLDEIIRATGQAFVGLTIGCARCHDHKFDPIRQSDYYAMYATFAGIRHGAVPLATPEEHARRSNQLAPLQQEQAALETSITQLTAEVLGRGKEKLAEYRGRWKRPKVDRRGTEETFAPVTAKLVRFRCEAGDTNLRSTTGFGIDEFEIWSVPAADGEPAKNVALASNGGVASGKARHIEDFPDAYSPTLAIDGQTGARFLAADNQLTIELAQPTRINRIVFSSARGAAKPDQGKFRFVAEYRIEVSLDGEHWKEIAHGRDRAPTTFGNHPTHEEYRLLRAEKTDEERKEESRLRAELRSTKAAIAAVPSLPSVWIGSRRADEAKGPFHVFLGGNPQKPGDQVQPRGLAVLPGDWNYQLDEDATEADRRHQLARWITHDQNPLTPRVLANRLWHYHFGTGIVDTPSDFGYMGGRPSHPELLDFLASKLLEANWRLKPLHRMIMLSQAYRQSSTLHPVASKVDANARLLWRFPPRRLSAEEIRDTLLTLGGKIQRESDPTKLVPDGGPGFRLYHFMQDNVCTYVPLDRHGAATYRRAVYHQNARASVVDLMTDFDQPDCAFSTPRRSRTTTPLQALTMLNHTFTLDMASALAGRVESMSDDRSAQIQSAYELCFGRDPTHDEVASCSRYLDEFDMTGLCRVLLNTSELIYVR